MNGLESLSAQLPESCKDLRMNLASVLRPASLTPTQAWSVALASAYFVRLPALTAALLADGKAELSEAAIEDARAAAALMGMTTVYYRFRHMLNKPVYNSLPAGLRMNRMSTPATSKVQFEMCALACAALAGCEACIRSHEASLIKESATEQQINDVVRIAAAVSGFTVALGSVSS